jgi:hypothetical protein
VAESKHEQIVAALVTLLDGITSDAGTTYWYTPNVTRVAGVTPDLLMPEKASGTASICAVIAPGRVGEEESTHESTERARVQLVLLKLWNPSIERPFVTPDPDRLKLQNRLVQDVQKKLNTDLTLGGLVDNLTEGEWQIDTSAENTFVEGWACVFLEHTILYSYDKATP